MDVGSGGGFPGIVIAILNKYLDGALSEIVLVESDLKKSLFLKECIRLLDLNVEVQRERVENLKYQPDVITARAFALELPKLWRLFISRLEKELRLLHLN